MQFKIRVTQFTVGTQKAYFERRSLFDRAEIPQYCTPHGFYRNYHILFYTTYCKVF